MAKAPFWVCLYPINAQHCISSTRSVVYHQFRSIVYHHGEAVDEIDTKCRMESVEDGMESMRSIVWNQAAEMHLR